jgi:transcriptional regulator GlxA family with amidase domain
VERLADQAGMSPRQFIRAFQREKGMPPGRFLDQLRVDTARRMIEESDNGMKEIASLCGFGSVDTMRRTFVRVLGAAPGGFRRRANEAADLPVAADGSSKVWRQG